MVPSEPMMSSGLSGPEEDAQTRGRPWLGLPLVRRPPSLETTFVLVGVLAVTSALAVGVWVFSAPDEANFSTRASRPVTNGDLDGLDPVTGLTASSSASRGPLQGSRAATPPSGFGAITHSSTKASMGSGPSVVGPQETHQSGKPAPVQTPHSTVHAKDSSGSGPWIFVHNPSPGGDCTIDIVGEDLGGNSVYSRNQRLAHCSGSLSLPPGAVTLIVGSSSGFGTGRSNVVGRVDNGWAYCFSVTVDDHVMYDGNCSLKGRSCNGS